MLDIKNINQVTRAHGVKIALYGDSGIGKTVLATTCRNPLLVSSEKGTTSINQKVLSYYPNDEIVAHNVQNMAVLEIENVANNGSLTEEQINSPIKKLVELLNFLKTDNTFETVIFDSFTEIAEILLAIYVTQVKDNRKAYVTLNEKLNNFIKACLDLPQNIVFICQLNEATDENGNVSKIRPSLPGKRLLEKLPYMVDEVLLYKYITDAQGNRSRALVTTLDNDFSNFIAKDRCGNLDVYEYPHLQNIINKIRGF